MQQTSKLFIDTLPFVQPEMNFDKTKQSNISEGIIVSKPLRQTGSSWINYVDSLSRSSSNILDFKSLIEKMSMVGMLTREERKLKLAKFLEKRKRRHLIKKIRYQHRQQVADRRMRYKGRFVNIEEAKELMMKGEEVTANNRSDLDKLLEQLGKQNLLGKYYEIGRAHV